MRMKGKVAIVTGAASGLGRGIAERFATEGALVWLVDCNAAGLRATRTAIVDAGGIAEVAQCDVANEQQVERMAAGCREHFGRIDVLVNNAGVILYPQEGRAHEIPAGVWERTLAVNLTGYWLCAKYVLPSMIEQRGGSIIFVASPTGQFGFKGLAAYSASKGGTLGLMRSMAADYAPDNIRVNAIIPGTMLTGMTQEELSDPQLRQHFAQLAPAGRVGSDRDLDGMAVFLATDDADYCVGGIFAVDGGLTAV